MILTGDWIIGIPFNVLIQDKRAGGQMWRDFERDYKEGQGILEVALWVGNWWEEDLRKERESFATEGLYRWALKLWSKKNKEEITHKKLDKGWR